MKEKTGNSGILKVAAYARVSTDKEDQTNSLESQKSYFAQYINEHEGWMLTKVYYDEGISGTQTGRRRGFNAMIDAAQNGGIDLILTKEVCRFARNTVDTLYYTRKLKEAGVGVIFTIDNINTMDSDGELRLTIMACIAQEESRKTSERVKWGQKRRMEQGVVFGRSMLGYTVKGGILTVNEKEALTVRAIFHKYANEDKSVNTIAKELAKEGMYPQNAQSWSGSVILRVLKNEKYVGDLCQKKTITPDFLTHAKKYNHGEEEMIYLTDHHEAIIDRKLWERAQRKLKARSKAAGSTGKKGSVSRYWCSGRIYCAECGSCFVRRIKKRSDGTVYKAWRCYAAASFGAAKSDENGNISGCSNISINEKALLSCIYYAVGLLQTDFEELKNEIIENLRRIKSNPDEKDVQRLCADIERLKDKKKKAIDLMLEKLISEEDFRLQLKWYEDEIRLLTTALNQKRHEVCMSRCECAVDEIMDFKNDINCGNEHFICKEILEKITIHQDSMVEVQLKCIPFGIRMQIKSSGKTAGYHTEIINSELYNII